MLFTISRTSDNFMDCELPNPRWSPHKKAVWSDKYDGWVIELKSLEEAIGLATDDINVVIRRGGTLSHIELDDITYAIPK